MRSLTRWLLVVVFVFDALFALAVFSGWLSRVDASSEAPQPVAAAPPPVPEPAPAEQTLRRLGEELGRRSIEMDRRETEFQELLRGAEVLRRTGLLPEAAAVSVAEPIAEAKPPVVSAAFEALRKAYENMEAESAAKALAELSRRDKEVVIELLIRWNPRTSGAILDSLAQDDPGLAADLSYEVWKSGGGASAHAPAGGAPAP